jgi:hypothetical protein
VDLLKELQAAGKKQVTILLLGELVVQTHMKN